MDPKRGCFYRTQASEDRPGSFYWQRSFNNDPKQLLLLDCSADEKLNVHQPDGDLAEDGPASSVQPASFLLSFILVNSLIKSPERVDLYSGFSSIPDLVEM